MNEIQCKRVYELPVDTDGYRILVDRLWPRGINRETAKISQWAKDIAPSSDLRKWFSHDPQRFGEFSVQYTRELDSNPSAEVFMDDLRRTLADAPVTFLYAAKDTEYNHALVLKNWADSRLPGRK